MSVFNIFERTEMQYLLTAEQFDRLSINLADQMVIDQYGRHTICDLYYDTPDFALVRQAIRVPRSREKLRLRSFGTPQQGDLVCLELETGLEGQICRHREELPLEDAQALLSQEPFLQETSWFSESLPEPKALLAYDRIALYSHTAPGLRITFDDSIRWRTTALDLTMGDWGVPLLERTPFLMAITHCGKSPSWLSRALSELEVAPVEFSGYAEVYRQILLPREQSHSQRVYCA